LDVGILQIMRYAAVTPAGVKHVVQRRGQYTVRLH